MRRGPQLHRHPRLRLRRHQLEVLQQGDIRRRQEGVRLLEQVGSRWVAGADAAPTGRRRVAGAVAAPTGAVAASAVAASAGAVAAAAGAAAAAAAAVRRAPRAAAGGLHGLPARRCARLLCRVRGAVARYAIRAVPLPGERRPGAVLPVRRGDVPVDAPVHLPP